MSTFYGPVHCERPSGGIFGVQASADGEGEKIPVFARKLYFSTVSWYPYKAHAIQACGCTGSGCGLRAAKKNV